MHQLQTIPLDYTNESPLVCIVNTVRASKCVVNSSVNDMGCPEAKTTNFYRDDSFEGANVAAVSKGCSAVQKYASSQLPGCYSSVQNYWQTSVNDQ